MGYTDLDRLAINTIRVLAVSSLLLYFRSSSTSPRAPLYPAIARCSC